MGKLRAALAVYFAFYNFCRVHKSLRVTPAMEAGITEHIWTIRELLEVARSDGYRYLHARHQASTNN
jgi:hypothetical protein